MKFCNPSLLSNAESTFRLLVAYAIKAGGIISWVPFRSLVNILQLLKTEQVWCYAILHAKSWRVWFGYDVSHMHHSGVNASFSLHKTEQHVYFRFVWSPDHCFGPASPSSDRLTSPWVSDVVDISWLSLNPKLTCRSTWTLIQRKIW